MVIAIGKRQETRDQAINRLAEEARKAGVQIFYAPIAKEYYATSQRNPGELHRVTLFSCDCVGFLAHQRCRHHAALLDYCGELPPVEPTSIVALTPEERAPQSVPTPATDHLHAALNARVAAAYRPTYKPYGECLRRLIDAERPADLAVA